ncbi:MAG: hypothetical protein JSS02_34490 [Planctomycetes bacterium]|nr:hypothetical protein [Planctomycetota bacterium]
MSRRILCVNVLAAVVLTTGLDSFGADVSGAIKTIRAVDNEGKGNKEALTAWRELSQAEVADLPKILAGFDGANPLAMNYLRSAVETIVDRSTAAGGKLPATELEKFLFDTKHDPKARRLTFELLAKVDPQAPDRIIPKMINDPSVELRRDAVARLIEAGKKLLAAEKPTDEQSQAARQVFAQALDGARDDDQVQEIKKQLEGLGQSVDLPSHFGFLLGWKLVAPFDNTDKKGLNIAYPPEKQLDLKATYQGKEDKEIQWVEHTTTDEYGIVDLAKVLSPFKGAVAYAVTEFQSPTELPVEFRLGTPNSWKVWLNGDLLFGREEYHRGMTIDQYRMKGTLKAGKNTILIKVCQNEQTEEWAQRWAFQLRVCDATGTAILSADRTKKTAKPGQSTGSD